MQRGEFFQKNKKTKKTNLFIIDLARFIIGRGGPVGHHTTPES
jgi:hypothetical protein